MKARGLNEKLSNLVGEFARDSVDEMKPIVLRMMKQARTLRGKWCSGRREPNLLFLF